MITPELLIKLCNGKISTSKANLFTPLLNKYMVEYDINNKLRVSAFIANLLVESGRLIYTEELASGHAYEFRKDLGNTIAGDGVKFKGRGLIQITGRTNYQLLFKAFNQDFIKFPELLEQPDNATRSACWFWSTHKLNTLADKPDFKEVVRVINGGHNGMTERQWYYDELMKIIE